MPFLKRSVLLLILLTGCGQAEPVKVEAPAPQPPPKPETILIHLPGVSGEMPVDRNMTRGLILGKVAPKVTIYDWAGPNRGIVALGSLDYNKEQAKLLAEKIEDIYHEKPHARIIVTTHSGGAGIAVWMLESLPANVKIDTLMMLASALSPDYDLSAALSHVNRAISLYSKYDDLVLGQGTRTLGTIDRMYSDSAGFVGYNASVASDPAQYAKLKQIPYDRAWVQFGNAGDHVGPMDIVFARDILSPMLGQKSE